MHRNKWEHWWRYLVAGAAIFAVLVGAFWFAQDKVASSKGTSFDCRSLDDPKANGHLDIQRSLDGQKELVFESEGTKRIFVVDSIQSGSYSASHNRTDGLPADSFYFNRQTGVVVEVATGSARVRRILEDRCNQKIKADVCLARMHRAVKGAAVDRNDCVSPAVAECKTWRSQRLATFELQFSCTPRGNAAAWR